MVLLDSTWNHFALTALYVKLASDVSGYLAALGHC